MLTSLALIFLLGLSLAFIAEKLKLPRLIGLLLAGLILGPHVLNALDPKLLSISTELRQMALVVILIRAGISLDFKRLKQVGRPAILLSFVPASFEILGYTLLASLIFHLSFLEAALTGAVLSAVSPAVVVPRMIALQDSGLGSKKGIPQMILAGSSCDDVYVIVLFSSFVAMLQGNGFKVLDLVQVPTSILLGILLGIIVARLYSIAIKQFEKHFRPIASIFEAFVIFGIALLLIAFETLVKPYVSIAALLGIMAMGIQLQSLRRPEALEGLQSKFSDFWGAAETLLFALVAAGVDINYMFHAGLRALLLIFLCLLVRSIGVFVSLLKTGLKLREKIFVAIAYTPKATVQAAIGGLPLAYGFACGDLILSLAVLSIFVTASLGAFFTDLFAHPCLHETSQEK